MFMIKSLFKKEFSTRPTANSEPLVMSKNRPMTKIYTTLTITQCQKACICVKPYNISVFLCKTLYEPTLLKVLNLTNLNLHYLRLLNLQVFKFFLKDILKRFLLYIPGYM